MGEQNSVGFDWNRARAFLAAAEAGSFSAAARVLGIAQPTIGRQIASLERELGVALFERVKNGLELTPTALELVEHVRAMADSATHISRVAAGQSLSLEGPISITAGDMVAAHLLPPMLAKLRATHPQIEVEVVVSNELRDLSQREADIAIRHVPSTQPELIAQKVREAQAGLYGTPDYLASLGNPMTPQALSRAEFIGFNHRPELMEGLNALGLNLTPKSFPWICGNQHVQWALVAQGSGIGIMLTDIADRDPRVQRALPELSIPVPMYLTAHREVKTSRRVRAAYDVLAAELKNG